MESQDETEIIKQQNLQTIMLLKIIDAEQHEKHVLKRMNYCIITMLMILIIMVFYAINKI